MFCKTFFNNNNLYYSHGAYFKEIGNALVANGYVRNVSMRGAGYDFRKGPSKTKKQLKVENY